MLLKRRYDSKELASYNAAVEQLRKAGAASDQLDQVPKPQAMGLEIKHVGTQPEQNFSTSLVAQLTAQDLVSIDGDKLTIDAEPEPLRYTILRKPGYYCCHTGKRIEMSPEAYGDPAIAAIEARQYLKDAKLLGKPSPDKNNPAGYRRTHAYECVLDIKQHERFKAVRGALAPSMSHTTKGG